MEVLSPPDLIDAHFRVDGHGRPHYFRYISSPSCVVDDEYYTSLNTLEIAVDVVDPETNQMQAEIPPALRPYIPVLDMRDFGSRYANDIQFGDLTYFGRMGDSMVIQFEPKLYGFQNYRATVSWIGYYDPNTNRLMEVKGYRQVFPQQTWAPSSGKGHIRRGIIQLGEAIKWTSGAVYSGLGTLWRKVKWWRG